MAEKPLKLLKWSRDIPISKYIDVNWIVKLTNEQSAGIITNQAFRVFQKNIYDKYVPRYSSSKKMERPNQRRATQRRLKRQLQVSVNKFFADYRRTSLNSLSKATVAAKRLQYRLVEDIPRKDRVRVAGVRALQQRSRRRKLQLGTGTVENPMTKHAGNQQHVIRKLIAGIDREMRQINPDISPSEQRYRIAKKTGHWFKTVARTEANAVMADADLQALKEVFDEVRYVAILDERTTDRCARLDGQIYKSVNPTNKPPQHFNCRSELQPKVEEPNRDRALAKASKVKFKTWLADQDEKMQRRVVGNKMFDAYKAGKYDPPPRWKRERRVYSDPETGLPVWPTEENIKRLNEEIRVIDVVFDPRLAD